MKRLVVLCLAVLFAGTAWSNTGVRLEQIHTDVHNQETASTYTDSTRKGFRTVDLSNTMWMDAIATASALVAATPTTIAVSWSPGKIIGFVDGTEVLVDASVAGATNTSVVIGQDGPGCWIRNLKVYQEALSRRDLP